MVSNEDLVQLALSGDQDAYTALYSRLVPVISKVSWKFFHGNLYSEDFEVDAQSHILMRLHKFNGEAKFSTWATRVAINYGLGVLRASKKARERSVSLDDTIGESDVSVGSTLADTRNPFARLEARCDAEKILSRMNPKDRDLVVAVHVHGMSSAEIATRTGRTLRSAKTAIHRAKFRGMNIMSDLQNNTLESLPVDSETGFSTNPVADRIVHECEPKICHCGCGETFTSMSSLRKYKHGHSPTAKGIKTGKRIEDKLISALVSQAPASEMVTLRVSASVIDRLISSFSTKQKAAALERMLAEV